MKTIIVLNRDTLETEYRADYIIYGQFMKFIQHDAVRVESTGGGRTLGHAAFLHPDGWTVLIVGNAGAKKVRFLVESRGGQFESELPERAVATYSWNSPAQ